MANFATINAYHVQVLQSPLSFAQLSNHNNLSKLYVHHVISIEEIIISCALQIMKDSFNKLYPMC
jgi:hypothetical protein